MCLLYCIFRHPKLDQSAQEAAAMMDQLRWPKNALHLYFKVVPSNRSKLNTRGCNSPDGVEINDVTGQGVEKPLDILGKLNTVFPRSARNT